MSAGQRGEELLSELGAVAAPAVEKDYRMGVYILGGMDVRCWECRIHNEIDNVERPGGGICVFLQQEVPCLFDASSRNLWRLGSLKRSGVSDYICTSLYISR